MNHDVDRFQCGIHDTLNFKSKQFHTKFIIFLSCQSLDYSNKTFYEDSNDRSVAKMAMINRRTHSACPPLTWVDPHR